MKNITLFDEGKTFFNTMRINLIFPVNIKVSDMLKAIYLKFGCDKRVLLFQYSFNINKTIGEEFHQQNNTIYVSKGGVLLGGNIQLFGKKIKGNVLYGNNKHYGLIIGTLNSNKELFNKIQIDLNIKIKKIYINKKKFNTDKIKSLLSLGIINDFECSL